MVALHNIPFIVTIGLIIYSILLFELYLIICTLRRRKIINQGGKEFTSPPPSEAIRLK